jgi:hypothetical protein
MAADMQRWIDCAASAEIPMVPAFSHWEKRAGWRLLTRAKMGVTACLEAERALPPMPCDMPLPDMAEAEISAVQ